MTRVLLVMMCAGMIAGGVLIYEHHRQLKELAHRREAGAAQAELEEKVAGILSGMEEMSNAMAASIGALQAEFSGMTARVERADVTATRLMELAEKNLRAREATLRAQQRGAARRVATAPTARTDSVPRRRKGGPVYTDDLSEWPNNVSKANSDEWIVEHHQKLRVMKPRLLVINFAKKMPRSEVRKATEQLIKALEESSKWHGYAENSPAFLRYEVWRYVDCNDCPVKASNQWLDYDKLYTQAYAKYWGMKDADNSERYLTLSELVDEGYVHELWMFFDPNDKIGMFESIEWKPVYDEQFKRKEGEYRMAGNGGDPDVRWTGRSLRFTCLNKDRGIGCGMENLAHAIEGTSNSGCIPYFTKYFREYAMLNLRERYGVPFDSLYETKMEQQQIRYLNRSTAEVMFQGARYVITNYVVAGGNVHFPPNARQHYDMRNITPVMSTIENWRMGNGAGGADKAEPWTSSRIPRSYHTIAPDCMGAWIIYWRQNMPGLDNRARDDEGKPMLNWWPFLFY